MSERAIMVCAGCGSETALFEHMTKAGWRSVRIAQGDDGKPTIEEAGRWEAGYDPEPTQLYGCSTPGCEYEESEMPLARITKIKPREGAEPPPFVHPDQVPLQEER